MLSYVPTYAAENAIVDAACKQGKDCHVCCAKKGKICQRIQDSGFSECITTQQGVCGTNFTNAFWPSWAGTIGSGALAVLAGWAGVITAGGSVVLTGTSIVITTATGAVSTVTLGGLAIILGVTLTAAAIARFCCWLRVG